MDVKQGATRDHSSSLGSDGYGWPRLCRELGARGVRAGKERVRKLIKAQGLQARGKRKFKARMSSASRHRDAMENRFVT